LTTKYEENEERSQLIESTSLLTSDNQSITSTVFPEPPPEIANQNQFEAWYEAIEMACPSNNKVNGYVFPHPRQWIEPRAFSVWIIPMITINKIRRYFYSIYLYFCH